MNNQIKVALVDDHMLVRKALSALLEMLGFRVLIEVGSGTEFLSSKDIGEVDVVLMDYSMAGMNGAETTETLRKKFPDLKVIALSSFDDEEFVMKMIRAGARGYLLKDSEPDLLKRAIREVMEKGYFNSELVTQSMFQDAVKPTELKSTSGVQMNKREEEFLKWACTELTYKEIADRMNVATRSVDNYRDALFEKLGIKSRVGLVIYAIGNGFYRIE
jgi:two-component system invasion response regulator UvrY